MALVLRSDTDLVYRPDHGYVGEAGAIAALQAVTSRIHRVDLSHNALGDDGVTTLFRGLSTLRSSFSRPPDVWSLRDVNLGCNRFGDEGFDAVLGYARKDLGLRRVLLQANMITLGTNVETVVNAINRSNIVELSMNDNPLHAESASRFFQLLDAPSLRSLHLSTCRLGPPVGVAVAHFLASARSRGLETLQINGNEFGLAAVRRIVDVIERGNTSLVRLGMFACGSMRTRLHEDLDDPAPPPEPAEDLAAEARLIAHEVQARLPPLLARNFHLTKRVRRAALRAVAPARILLLAQPLPPALEAPRVISSISSGASLTHFRLLDLPREILLVVARHASGDAYALSDAQWGRLVLYAENRATMAKAIRARAERRLRARNVDELHALEMESRDNWLHRGHWDRWEADRQ